MPNALCWTRMADETICGMRAAGATWAEIARVLSLSRNTVIERGRRLRAEVRATVAAVVVPDEGLDDPHRGPLCAGHRLTWGLLSDEPYPKGDMP